MTNQPYKRVSGKSRSAYRDYYTLKNLGAVRTGSIIFLILNIILRILYFIFPESLTRAQNYPEFNYTNWLYICITPLFWGGSYLFIYLFNRQKKTDMVMGLFVFAFAFYIIFCGMYSSFIATSDPRNALTLYLTALSIISVVFVLENVETIILIVMTELVFTYLLYYTAAEPMEMVYDQIISFTLLFCFYFISRYFYSYKSTYFIQLMDIRDKNIAIEKGNAFKNEILGMVAHDLRNPIGAIETIAMMMEMEDVDKDTHENLEMIKTSCAKARGIVADLLDAASNENINIIDTQRTELNHFLKRIIGDWKAQKNGKGNIVLIGSKNQLFAEINAEKFQRVMDNLITNALKFSKENGKIDIYLSEKDKYAIIEVRDYGVGIPHDMLPHIFERFSKARRPGVRGEQSTGLGLSISKQIIENHNGTIEVMSEEKKGSTFTIKLPIVE
ncbi:sensor histidine kinase [Mucilaginibacter ginsenosidivorans]|uniref:histidine kinase n=1 Tax=Mucilaginibacter ginsenosidivorans TaxID=398053 RepID=A0A5B8V2D8_9SPHI|nr:HAMP domain-containing sensor histidine kinase [Mucilaginibacter ginsenosidivorans]QEC64706.1 HAMP domain-containing histidine kinase [Mucilaginibacter ginsenosidivorans]